MMQCLGWLIEPCACHSHCVPWCHAASCSSPETPRALNAYGHASHAKSAKPADPTRSNGAFADGHAKRQSGPDLPGRADERHTTTHDERDNHEGRSAQGVSSEQSGGRSRQKPTTKGGRLSPAKQVVAAAKRGSLAATNVAAGFLSPSKRAPGAGDAAEVQASGTGGKGHGARTRIDADGAKRKKSAGSSTPTISTEAGGRTSGGLFKSSSKTVGHSKTISFENDSLIGMATTPRDVGADSQGPYVSSYLEPDDLNARPTWDSSPMRSRPAALRGLRPVTREPWATDEEVYKQYRGALSVTTGRYLGTPERYLDKTARKREAEHRETHYRNRLGFG